MEKITQRLIFPDLSGKPIHYQFDEPHSSSDGGALLLKAADQKLQPSSALAACLVDGRQAAKVKHSLEDLLRQRIYGLASGYADANDAARLAHDPIFKLLAGIKSDGTFNVIWSYSYGFTINAHGVHLEKLRRIP
jgi:Transposase DDE domain group 1